MIGDVVGILTVKSETDEAEIINKHTQRPREAVNMSYYDSNRKVIFVH